MASPIFIMGLNRRTERRIGFHLKLLIRCANVLLDRASQSTIELDQCDLSEERSILHRWERLCTAAHERA
jgi:hypothetical protein